MKRSDERQKLEEEYTALKKSGSLRGDAADFIDSVLALLDKTEMRLADLEDRISKLEDFSDIISMDLFDIQSALFKDIRPEAMEGHGARDIFAGFDDGNDEDDFDNEEECDCGSHHDRHDCPCDEDEEEEDDDDDEENKFIRCPYCNTLIFIKGDEENLVCPFCGEKFLLSDTQ